MTPQEQATEFARRRSLPRVESRIMGTKRSLDVVLTLDGRDVGWQTKSLTRGRVTSVTFVLPEMPPSRA